MTDTSNKSQRSAAKVGPRVRGLLMLLIGLTLAKWQIYDPLHAREQGVDEVAISSTLVGAALLLSVLGAASLVAGERIDKVFEKLKVDPKQLSWKCTAFLLATALICGSVWIWLQLELSAQGYS